MGAKMFGARVKRLEDPALLTGRGVYVDDIHLPGMLEAAFVRSPHAHARIRGIDKSRAEAAPGVRAVFTLDDLPGEYRSVRVPFRVPNPAISQPLQQGLLERDEVCFVGEPVALVVAETRYQAEDAAILVEVDYAPLPAASDARDALKDGAPLAHAASPNNEGARFTVGYGDVDGTFAAAPHVVRETL